jgi:K(+)-stimulated pyrophosphate-energized sodium pump
MTELVVVLFLAIIGLSTAAYLVRWLLSFGSPDNALLSAASLVRDVAEGFARRQSATLAALAALFGGALFVAYGLRTPSAEQVGGLETAVWLVLSFGVGVLGAIAAAEIGTFIGVRGAIRTAAASRRNVDAALRSSFRSGAALSLLSASIGTVSLAALILAVIAFHGGVGQGLASAVNIIPRIPFLLLGYALGATTMALFGQIAGGTFAKSADIGADVGARDAGLDDDAKDNPAAVANLAGDCANGAASSHVTAYAAAAAEDSAAMLAVTLVYAADLSLRSPLSLILLPLLSRSFSILGTVFAAVVVRTDDREDPFAAVLRGLTVATLLQAVGLAGAVQWLLPERRVLMFGASAIGIGLAAVIVVWVYVSSSSRFRAVRDVAEAARVGPTLNVLAGISNGLRMGLPIAAALTLGIGASHALGVYLYGRSGGTLALVATLSGLVGTMTFLMALDGMATVVDAASGLVAMTSEADRRDARGRLSVLDAAGAAQRIAARIVGTGGALLSGVLLCEVLRQEADRLHSALGELRLDVGVWVGAMLGIGLTGWLAGRCLTGVLRSSRRIVEEVRRQLRDRSPAEADGPLLGSVDHRPCSESATRHALRHMVLAGSQALVLLIALLVGLHLARGDGSGFAAGGAVLSLIMTATVTGVVSALLAFGAGGAWGSAKKYIVTGAHGGRLHVDETGARAENPTFVASVIGDTVGDPFKDVAVPCVIVLIRLLPIVALVLLPLIH